MSDDSPAEGAGDPGTSAADNCEPAADDRAAARAAARSSPTAAEQPDPAVEAPAARPADTFGDDPTGGADGGASAEPVPTPPDAVFSQQLWEVQLLLDFLSGNPQRRLPDKAAATTAGLPEDWIEQVCRMTWPPSGNVAVQAEQEALLVKVKDHLNQMASPASGASVAFTLLVAQEESSEETPKRRRWRAPTGEAPPRQAGMTQSRRSLAQRAFPDLCAKSATFRQGMFRISLALAAWLGFTCLLTWYVALGDAGLRRLATARVALEDVRVKIDAAQTVRATTAAAVTPKPTATPKAPATAARTFDAANLAVPAAAAPTVAISSSGSVSGVAFCDQPLLLPRQRTPEGRTLVVYGSPAQALLCANLDVATRSVDAAERSLRRWLPPGAWRGDDPAAAAEAALAWVSTLANSILPICYGILGAAAAVLRLLSRRMRLSLLTPRDWTLSLQQLALGAVVGACIGLFVGTPDNGTAGSSQLFGSVKLSNSALSFVAGFGVDAVFAALEALIARLFATTPPATR